MLLTSERNETAPIEVPEFVTAYEGWHRPAGRNEAATHHWRIRGYEFLTLDNGTDVYSACGRCGGCGEFSYNEMDGTMCYGCYGSGLGKAVKGWDDAQRLVKAREARARAAERKLMRELHQQAIDWNAWYAAAEGRQGMIAALLAQPRDEYTNEYGTDFLGKMATLVRMAAPLTEKQEAAVMRTLGQRAERIEAKQAAGHWGEVGKRAEVAVTVRSVRAYDGDYGTRHLVLMETADGQTLKTWATGAFGHEALIALRDNDGQPVVMRIKATVKAHSEYQGAPQTELTRVAVVG